MTVMRETGLIVVSTGHRQLFQFSLWTGRLIQKEIKPPCDHYVHLLCVQVAGQEYLAVSCWTCRDIKLMDLYTQKLSFAPLIQCWVITALSGRRVKSMCQGEENRLFVGSDDTVLELDTSTTTFTKVKTINTGSAYSLCYLPDPYRLLVVSDEHGSSYGEVHALSCDDNEVTWRTEKSEDFNPGCLLFVPNNDVLLVADKNRNEIHIVNAFSGTQKQLVTLPDHVEDISGLCWFVHQIVMCSKNRISFLALYPK